MQRQNGQTSKTPNQPLIIGGGHSGLLLALALHRSGLPSTIIDADPADQVLKAPFDGRALALMQGSKRVFDALDLWPEFETIATPIYSVKVQDTGTGGLITYDACDVGDDAFGYGMETRRLRTRLLELVQACPEIRYLGHTRLDRLSREPDAVSAHLSDGQCLRTQLLIGADGRRSSVRDFAGIRTNQVTYDQIAITLAFRHEKPHDHRVREYMNDAGPLALLPIGEQICSATWIERPSDAEKLLNASPARQLKALSDRQNSELGPLEILGEPKGFPLTASMAKRYVAPRVALVGDAAHGLHPIHAQGWNLGVRDVAALTEILVDAARAQQDPGGGDVLQRYARWRSGDAHLILSLTDGLNRLFSTDFVPAKLLRRTSLTVLDRIAPLKTWVMRRGMGMSGNLPKLARGLTL